MNNGAAKIRIIWAVVATVLLCICYLLCRYTFFELHGSIQYPVFMLILGLIAIIIAAINDGRKVMICTVVGYIGSFASGLIFAVDGVDQGGAKTNNWWQIWTVTFIVCIL